MKNHFYIPSSQSQRDDLPLWDLESLDNESGKTPIPANIFPQVCYRYRVTICLFRNSFIVLLYGVTVQQEKKDPNSFKHIYLGLVLAQT